MHGLRLQDTIECVLVDYPPRPSARRAERVVYTMPPPKGYKKKPKLTQRQMRFLEAYSQVQTAGMAAVIAGYSAKHPDQSGHQALQQIKAKAADVLDAHGLTADHLIENYLAPALNAQKPVFFTGQGEPISFVLTNDWAARVRALDIAFKLRGDYATQEDILKDATSVRVIRIDVPRPQPPEVKNLSQGSGAKPSGIKLDGSVKT